MRLKRAGMALALAAAAAAALGVTAVVAGDVGDGPGQSAGVPEELVADAQRIDDPSAAAHVAGSARDRTVAKGREPRLIYLETNPPLTVPGPTPENPDGWFGTTIAKCPGGSKAINGYYFVPNAHTGFGLDNQGDSPRGFRRWSFYLQNQTGAPIEAVTFGIVCLKGVR